MDILKIMIAAFSATNLMTTFSYLMSMHYNSLFKEPVMLNYLLDQMGLTPKGKWKPISGWLAHYFIGLLFVFSYAALWKYTDIEFGWVSGILFGAFSAVIGILAWQLIYMLPDKKPAAPLKDYYIQLSVAHLIFACAVVAAFKL